MAKTNQQKVKAILLQDISARLCRSFFGKVAAEPHNAILANQKPRERVSTYRQGRTSEADCSNRVGPGSYIS